eukprot:5076062-Pyramimonas_sp.AAC.1
MARGSAGGLISYSAGIISSEKGGADLCAGGAEGTARRYLGVGPQPNQRRWDQLVCGYRQRE